MTARRSNRAGLLVLPAAFAAWWLFGTLDLNRAPSWNIRVTERDAADEIELYVTKNELGLDRHAADPVSESVRVEPTENGLRVTVPEEMLVTRSGWIVQIHGSKRARRESVHNLSVSVNGRLIEDDLRAKKKITLPISFANLGPGDNTFEFSAPIPRAFKRIRIRNHVTFYNWYPTFSVLRLQGPCVRTARSLVGLTGALAVGAEPSCLEQMARRQVERRTTLRQQTPLGIVFIEILTHLNELEMLGESGHDYLR